MITEAAAAEAEADRLKAEADRLREKAEREAERADRLTDEIRSLLRLSRNDERAEAVRDLRISISEALRESEKAAAEAIRLRAEAEAVRLREKAAEIETLDHCGSWSHVCDLMYIDSDRKRIDLDLYSNYQRSGPNHTNVSYILRETPSGGPSEILFAGSHFGVPQGVSLDSDFSILCLLGFLTLREGDSDPEYFADYTSRQLEWIESREADEIRFLCYIAEADHNMVLSEALSEMRSWSES